MKYPQSFFKAAGNYCCYALQLANIAKKLGFAGNEQEALEIGIENGLIEYDKNDPENFDNFTVLDAGNFVSLLTGKDYNVRHAGANYKAKDGEFVINFWAKSPSDARKGIGHFDSDDYHTLKHSFTVETGKVYSTRVVYPAK